MFRYGAENPRTETRKFGVSDSGRFCVSFRKPQRLRDLFPKTTLYPLFIN